MEEKRQRKNLVLHKGTQRREGAFFFYFAEFIESTTMSNMVRACLKIYLTDRQ